ncbi:MAG: RtcB family protein [Lentisphaeraceae bacterium]|nr:RtcB family protein [Lentisphaeraceae bacterium]
MGYQVLSNTQGKDLIKAWTEGVPFEEGAQRQVRNTASMPFIHKWVAVMPDVHLGLGATIGSVIPTKNAIIPAAVGVDIGCGMMAVQTSLTATDLPDDLKGIREVIERACPHGDRSSRAAGHKGGGWKEAPALVEDSWKSIEDTYKTIISKNPKVETKRHPALQIGSLGGGNHFIEICLDESNDVWIMLHSGSRGIGNKIGRTFIEKARKDMEKWMINLPDKDLAYFPEGTDHFDDYVESVNWAQNYARLNRETMMKNIIAALKLSGRLPDFTTEKMAVNCHHNYVEQENHFGENVFVTRKGAVRARAGELGIIPGSMGARSFIVRGKGNEDSFCSCSHGAGRTMSRTAAKKRYSVEDQVAATEGVECRKDAGVIDEIPMAYKDIDAVMEAQSDLVEIVHTLKQVVCVKG